jgi:hypothetical protein
MHKLAHHRQPHKKKQSCSQKSRKDFEMKVEEHNKVNLYCAEENLWRIPNSPGNKYKKSNSWLNDQPNAKTTMYATLETPNQHSLLPIRNRDSNSWIDKVVMEKTNDKSGERRRSPRTTICIAVQWSRKYTWLLTLTSSITLPRHWSADAHLQDTWVCNIDYTAPEGASVSMSMPFSFSFLFLKDGAILMEQGPWASVWETWSARGRGWRGRRDIGNLCLGRKGKVRLTRVSATVSTIPLVILPIHETALSKAMSLSEHATTTDWRSSRRF